MTNVVCFPGLTKLDMPVDQILEAAIGRLEYVVVLGYAVCDDDSPGGLYVASSSSDVAKMNFILDEAKQFIFKNIPC